MDNNTPYTPCCEVPRWVLFSRLSEVIGSTNWLVLQALIMTESRLVHLSAKKWKAGGYDHPFKVRVGGELTPMTGLSRRTVTNSLRALHHRRLIVYEPGGGEEVTRVTFPHGTWDGLAWYCLPRLQGYQGGFAGCERLPEVVYIWTHPDEYAWHYSADRVQKMAEAAAGRVGVDLEQIEKLVSAPVFKKTVAKKRRVA